MNHPTTKDWRDALAKIATEQLPDCTIKTEEAHDNRVEIYIPEQDEERWPYISVEVEAAGKLKRDRIRIFKNYRPVRDYETDAQFSRNIERIVTIIRTEVVRAKVEAYEKEAERKRNDERRAVLEKVADTAARLAFSNHKIERFTTEGDHKGGKVYMDFPKIKDEDGFAWWRQLILEYRANDKNELTWIIGKDMRVQIPDLATFAKTIC